ncbi:MAG TPA: hypothetical protein VKB26_04325 [Candidatus Acidoferrales bacterium]|nr:hypothetical protein [Candidatus Acidoferrales bacterium]
MIDKHEAKRITSEIRLVLLDIWDPIGVKDEPNAQDEYDCCLGGLFRLLTTHGTDDQIAEYLLQQETEHMGLGAVRKEAMYPTVAALRRIKLPRDPK